MAHIKLRYFHRNRKAHGGRPIVLNDAVMYGKTGNISETVQVSDITNIQNVNRNVTRLIKLHHFRCLRDLTAHSSMSSVFKCIFSCEHIDYRR